MAVPVMIASAVISAMAAMRTGQTQSEMAKYNAKLAETNSEVANAEGAAASDAQDRDSQRRIGAAIAAYGASGVDVGTGSPVDVLADSARQATLDNLTVKYNYKLRALGYQNQAGLDTATGEYALAAGRMGATASLLQGVGQALSTKGGTSSGGTAIPSTG